MSLENLKIYAFSGLGADSRVFNYLNLDVDLVVIDWIEPKKNESIENYARRLSIIIDTNQDFGLMGVSFGGLVAVEVSKLLHPKFTILISSVASKQEILKFFQLVGRSGILNLIPKSLFDPPRKLAHYLFGARNKDLLNQILDATDLKFAKWAVQELTLWKNNEQIPNMIRIHGTHDKLLPWKGTGNVELIEEGEHFMIVDYADEVSRIINQKILLFEK